MKITTITKEVMEALKPGDKLETIIGGIITVETYVHRLNEEPYPHLLTFKGFPNSMAFTSAGRYFHTNISPLDIVSIIKAPPKSRPASSLAGGK